MGDSDRIKGEAILHSRQRGASLVESEDQTRKRIHRHHEDDVIELQETPGSSRITLRSDGEDAVPENKTPARGAIWDPSGKGTHRRTASDSWTYAGTFQKSFRSKSTFYTFHSTSSFFSAKREVVSRKSSSLFKKYILQGLLRKRELAPTKDGRHIELDVTRSVLLLDERTDKPYINNIIRSSRYTIWTFFPGQIWFQFTKAANIYFLITGILQLIPGLSTTGSFTTILPLLVFLVFSMSREAWDDFRRYRLDKVENRSSARVLYGFRHGVAKEDRNYDLHQPSDSRDPYLWSTVPWSDLKVGDVIEVHRDEQVPADIALLYANGRNDSAFVETMALDGETNLKSKHAPRILAEKCGIIQDIPNCSATFIVEDPNLDLYEFNGRLVIDDKTLPLTPSNVIYRGSILRNTARAMGMIINTGEECKIRMNASKNPTAKAPRLQSETNKIVILLSVFWILLFCGCTAGYYIWQPSFESIAWYLADSSLPPAEILIAFAIQFNNFIPLALYVSLEIVKFAQFLLLQDIEMYDPISNTPMVSNTQTIFENLGQINYIFSDKTGTLTDNVMQFRKMTVAGEAWVHNDRSQMDTTKEEEKALSIDYKLPRTEIEEIEQQSKSPRSSRISATDDSIQSIYEEQPPLLNEPSSSQSIPTTKQLIQQLYLNPTSNTSQDASFFLLSLALCHTAFPEVDKSGKTTYQASSPDELALVEAAQQMGYTVSNRTNHMITLSIKRSDSQVEIQTYEILDVVEFSTKRKCMSIIIRLPDERICVFCKGADSVMWSKLGNGTATLDKSSSRIESCVKHVDEFANEGLRTLVFGHRFIDNEEYVNWKKTFDEATTSLVNRQEQIETAAMLIEQDLDLTGATAIEDKLQHQVPETIEKLQRANIKVWMLTGDKRETAINIAHSARLCKPHSHIFILDFKKDSMIEEQIRFTSNEIVSGRVTHSVLVVDGQTLSHIEGTDRTTSMSFYHLLLHVDSVICCRASPSQKAALVKQVRHLVPTSMTLAIGDGANDISMIQEAHVGVGISGKEGLQAARVADYSIAQFRFLQRLLLVHGHWNYMRTAKFVLLTFWKEMLFYAPQVMFTKWSLYTGTSLYESDGLTVWNTLFSGLVVIIPGIFEQDLSAQTLLAVPELYAYGQQSRGFNVKLWLRWMLMAVVDSQIIWWMVYCLYGNVNVIKDQGLFAIGNLYFSIMVVFINVKLL